MKTLLSILSICILLTISSLAKAQSAYWVFFTDKKDVSFDPYSYFDAKAIARRQREAIPICDSSDYPLNQQYVNAVAQLSDSITGQTRWFNALAIEASSTQIATIEKLPFVCKVRPMRLVAHSAQAAVYDTGLQSSDSLLLFNQIDRMQGFRFVQAGYTGQGIRIAIFDAGFPTLDKNPVFDHLYSNNQIIKTWNFPRKKAEVYSNNAHGTAVLSCVAGKIGDKQLGLATGADFLLARTEVETEPYSEEKDWLAAVEWADKNGADIINSSLGYTYHRYFPEQMDGETSLVVRAANKAAEKGILVLNAMGNDGDKDWHVLGTPADAENILSVGGIDPDTDYKIGFSSLGPTYDRRLKPNVSAYGKVIVAGRKKLKVSYGTSFSTPLVTGFAACAWQCDTNLTVAEIKAKIEQSGHLAPYFDYAHGYGIPQAGYFLKQENDDTNKELKKTFELMQKHGYLHVAVPDSFITDTFNHNLLYYHIANEDNILQRYAVVKVEENNALRLPVSDLDSDWLIRLHYRGYTQSIKVEAIASLPQKN